MHDHLLKKFHWPEYGAELLGTAFLLFAGLSAVILDFGRAVRAFRLLSSGERDILTGKLFHVTHYRSVFMNVRMPAMPPDGKLRQKEDRRKARPFVTK
jgi:hypothetical protein